MTTLGTVLVRTQRLEAKPGSQRRCYDGCFPSSDWDKVWSEWKELSLNVPKEKLEFWKEFSRDNQQMKWIQND